MTTQKNYFAIQSIAMIQKTLISHLEIRFLTKQLPTRASCDWQLPKSNGETGESGKMQAGKKNDRFREESESIGRVVRRSRSTLCTVIRHTIERQAAAHSPDTSFTVSMIHGSPTSRSQLRSREARCRQTFEFNVMCRRFQDSDSANLHGESQTSYYLV